MRIPGVLDRLIALSTAANNLDKAKKCRAERANVRKRRNEARGTRAAGIRRTLQFVAPGCVSRGPVRFCAVSHSGRAART